MINPTIPPGILKTVRLGELHQWRPSRAEKTELPLSVASWLVGPEQPAKEPVSPFVAELQFFNGRPGIALVVDQALCAAVKAAAGTTVTIQAHRLESDQKAAA